MKQKPHKLIAFSLCLATMLLMAACGNGERENSQGTLSGEDAGGGRSSLELIGAGATFPAPLVTAMADEYRDMTNGRITVNYQSIGSGGGIRQFVEQTVMFGMSEAYLSDQVMEEIEVSTGGEAFNMPITLADVVPTYNLPDVDEPVVFSGELLVDIYMGRVTRWDDPALVELNPGADLPSRPITVVHRSDGSGTTNLWTSYLSRISEEWSDRVGYGTSVSWPEGTGANGNEGVAGVVRNTPGAIGYNSLTYALLNEIAYGHVINQSGQIIEPSLDATTTAADIDLPEDTRVLFTNTPAPDGYPIAGFAWMLVYQQLDENSAISSREHARELVRFLVWTITEGQELSEDLGFARLPETAVERNMEMIEQLKWQDEDIGADMLEQQELL